MRTNLIACFTAFVGLLVTVALAGPMATNSSSDHIQLFTHQTGVELA